MLAHAPALIVWRDNDSKDELAPHVLKNLVYHDEGRGAFPPLKQLYGKIGAPELIDGSIRSIRYLAKFLR